MNARAQVNIEHVLADTLDVFPRQILATTIGTEKCWFVHLFVIAD
jgi:hypothetical protein